MLLHPQDVATWRKKNGTFAIGIQVSEEEYEMFCANYEKDKKYSFDVKREYLRSTQKQKNFFHRLVREMSEQYGWSFEDMKQHLITEYGRVVIGDINGMEKPLVLELEKGREKMPEIIPPKKDNDYYFKQYSETDTKVKYIAYKGIKSMNTREMQLLLDKTIEECKSLGIPVLSQEEYKKLKQQWKKEDHVVAGK